MFNLESMSRQGGASPGPVLYTYHTIDDMDVVASSGYFNIAYTWLKKDDLIRVVNTVNVYDLLVTAVSKKSVTIARISKMGWASYYDTATPLTPIAMSPGVWYPLPNDGLGPASNSSYLPYGYTDLWSIANQRFESDNLKLGDSVDLQIDLTWINSTGNTEVEIDLVLTLDSTEVRRVFMPRTDFKRTGTHQLVVQQGIFFENELSLNAKAKFEIRAEKASTVSVNSFYARLYLNG